MKLLYFGILMLMTNLLYGQETEVKYLSGTGADQTVDWEFYCSAGMNSGKWTTIAVPSCWEQQGFGAYNYGHDKHEERLNETGSYRYRFSVPSDWQSQQVNIVFEGVMTDAEVKINGKIAGPVHQGAFYRFSYDISKLLKYGKENLLEVFVKKNSDNRSVMQAEREADFWIFGGIFRPVFLEAKPNENISRVAVDAQTDGNFKADVYIQGLKQTHQISVQIETLSGEVVSTIEGKSVTPVSRMSGKVDHPKTWNPESPNLYVARFKLIDSKGKLIHQHIERIGFRTVEVRESDGIYVNGVRIKMQGVCRHTFHPKYGRTSSKELSIEAVNLMKDMNMNAVRMSHYPPEKHFLEVCDSLGLFVLDELTAWQKPSYDDVVGRKLLEEMIVRDVNHPSVILWDNGNEGGENNNLNDDFAELDIQQRKVLHPWQDYDRTNTLHYIDYNYLALDGYSKRKIFFPTEFLHGLYDGGHGAGLEDYWQKMWDHPLCAGGFLWVFADESVERTDRNGQLDSDGNHAPDGILGPYMEKEGSFFTIKEIWSPVYFEKRYITPEFDGKFRIQNRYFYTDLNLCQFRVEWVNFSVPGSTESESVKIMEELKIDLAPGQNGIMTVPLPENWQDYDALRISATDQYGRKLNTWSWPVKTPYQKSKELLPQSGGDRPVLNETGNEFVIQSGRLELKINKLDGTIKEIKKENQSIPLTNGPVFVGGDKKIKEIIPSVSDHSVKINVLYENSDQFSWTINGNGMVDLEVIYEPSNSKQFAGISFDYPEMMVAGMRWLGNGPYRVYKNRMKGVEFGLWEKAYNRTITGESGFIYPEFKGYHAEVYWAELFGKEDNGFKVYLQSPDIFLRLFTSDEPKDPAKTRMEYPKGDISFLHNINGIGTKFSEAAASGPQAFPSQFIPSRMHGGKMILKLTFDFR